MAGHYWENVGREAVGLQKVVKLLVDSGAIGKLTKNNTHTHTNLKIIIRNFKRKTIVFCQINGFSRIPRLM